MSAWNRNLAPGCSEDDVCGHDYGADSRREIIAEAKAENRRQELIFAAQRNGLIQAPVKPNVRLDCDWNRGTYTIRCFHCGVVESGMMGASKTRAPQFTREHAACAGRGAL